MIEVLTDGPANCIHDRGRRGLLHFGVSRSGAMDALSHDIANALVGNAADAATIEVAMFPFRLRIGVDTQIALTGADAFASLNGVRLPPFWVAPAPAGSLLSLSPPARGMRSYVAFAGGIDVPLVLGSRSTDLKSQFGGLDGKGLAKGDSLALLQTALRKLPTSGHGTLLDGPCTSFWSRAPGVTDIRVIPAAEEPLFTQAARAQFWQTGWQITHEANRAGYRLSGPMLALREPVELFSHGIMPGTVQVPPSGQPIIQLADANTCGGYPKMAVIAEPDLWKLAQLGPGDRIRFVPTTVAAALADQLAQSQMVQAIRAQA